eukprot:584239-Hanusia_phi.AAC.1
MDSIPSRLVEEGRSAITESILGHTVAGDENQLPRPASALPFRRLPLLARARHLQELAEELDLG